MAFIPSPALPATHRLAHKRGVTMLAGLLRILCTGPCPACGRAPSATLCPACRAWSAVQPTALEAELHGRPLLVVGAYHAESSTPRTLSPLGAAILAFKDRGDRYAGRCLGRLLAECVPAPPSRTVVVPVPPDPSRLHRRGFHPATWLAAGFARRIGLRLEPRALRRVGALPAQRALGGLERRRNATGAFELGSPCLRGYPVLLVDDVLTTGATVDNALRCLEASGVTSLGAAVLAAADRELAARCRSRTGNAGTAGTSATPR